MDGENNHDSRDETFSPRDYMMNMDIDEILRAMDEVMSMSDEERSRIPSLESCLEDCKDLEARKEASARSSNLLKSWSFLGEIIARHELTIQKRWANKTVQRRIDILLQAWPHMPPTHRPDFVAFQKETTEQRTSGTAYRDWYMFPYINQEDLSKPAALPLFLNARARCHPSEFAGFDCEAMRPGVVTGAIVPITLHISGMLLNGITAATEYGKFFHAREFEEGKQWVRNRLQYHPGEGLLILEIQDRVLRFLVDCCQQILHDIAPSALLSAAYPVIAGTATKHEINATGFDSLAVMALEAPCRPPAQIDFGRISSLLDARKSAAEDHLWSLREDPGYFADALFRRKEHRTELLPDSLGRPHPIWLQKRGHETFWGRVIGDTVTCAYHDVQTWSELSTQAQQLQKLQKSHAQEISPTKVLPEKYLHALLRFQFYLKKASKGPLKGLILHLYSSTPWRPFFARTLPQDLTSTIVGVMRREAKMSDIQDKMWWLIGMLGRLGDEVDQLGQFNVVDELDHLVQTKAEAKAMLTDFVTESMDDLIIASECLRQLSLYQPWARNFEDATKEMKDSIMHEWDEGYQLYCGMFRPFDRATSYVRLGDPSDKKFEYPVARRRTKANTEAMRQAESKLDTFWKAIDQLMHGYAKNLRETAVGRLLSQSTTLRRTPEWVEPAKRASSSSNSNVEDLIKPLSECYFDLGSHHGQSKATTEHARSKTKVKTRGRPGVSGEISETPAPAGLPTSNDPQPTLPVDARALKVFRTLFYTPSSTATPGEVPWNDFLHAMVSTGFRAEKLYGSVWQFTPTNLSVERGIQFHEPHPSPKIPYWIARRFGRRLTRTYGWETGMFVLKSKETRDGDDKDGKKIDDHRDKEQS